MSENTAPKSVLKVEGYRDMDYRRGYDFDPCSIIGALTAQELRADIGRAEGNIRGSIHNHNISTADGFCGLHKAIGDAECNLQDKIGNAEARISNQNTDNFGKLMLHTANLERDIQNIVWDQGRFLTGLIGDKTDKILEKVDRENDQLSRDLQNHRLETIKGFGEQKLELCHTENRLARQLEACCCELKELQKDSEISRLKDELQKEQFKSLIRDACCGNGNGNGNNAR